MIDKYTLLILKKSAHNMRQNIIELAYKAGSNGAHLGSALSIVDIMAVLYCEVMDHWSNDPRWEGRDRLILSKGHGSAALYTALYEFGIIDKDKLFTYEDNGGDLPGQPAMNQNLGIEFSGGSLGLGLSLGAGQALACRMKHILNNIFVLIGDGELNEGSIWEAVMLAAHYKLNNLIAIIDNNELQSDGKTSEVLEINITKMWNGFGWNVINVDGHNIEDLYNTLSNAKLLTINQPTVIIAKTVKGKGISFMENNNDWHHAVLIKDKYELAISELKSYGESL